MTLWWPFSRPRRTSKVHPDQRVALKPEIQGLPGHAVDPWLSKRGQSFRQSRRTAEEPVSGQRTDPLDCFLQDSERQRLIAKTSGRQLELRMDHHRLKISIEAPAMLHLIEQKARKRLMVRPSHEPIQIKGSFPTEKAGCRSQKPSLHESSHTYLHEISLLYARSTVLP